MSTFDGIDRSTACGFAVGPPQPITIELIREGFRRMLAWRPPPPPEPDRINDESGVIIWSMCRREIDALRARGLTGEAMARQLALTTPLGYLTALGFVAWMESALERHRFHGVESKIAALIAEQQIVRATLQPAGMRRARDERAKPAPPVPPWARERKRRR